MKLSRYRGCIAVAAVLLLSQIVLGLSSGVVDISWRTIISHVLPWQDSLLSASQELIVFELRSPRVLAVMAVGAGLAVSGALMQGLFRNPLADPGLLGVSAGASLGAIAAIVLGGVGFSQSILGVSTVSIAAFIMATITTVLLLVFSRVNGRIHVALMLLVGVALNAVLLAGASLFKYLADDTELRQLVYWQLGSFSQLSWSSFAGTIPVFVVCFALMLRYSKTLDALLLGEDNASALGVDVAKVSWQLVLLIAVMVALSVSLVGIIGFVGLIVPHLVRLAVGPGHQRLVPATALLGAGLLLCADNLAKTLIAPSEVPIGVLTAFIGGPFFLMQLIYWKRKVWSLT